MADIYRTKETADKYKEYRASGVMDSACALCPMSAIKQFTYWKLISNDFPYDLISSVHEMLVPLRHATEKELSREEWEEFQTIKAKDLQEYDYLVEATNKNKSIPEHFHLHLLVGKAPE